jgi:pyrroline-5-carboxylate reductase
LRSFKSEALNYLSEKYTTQDFFQKNFWVCFFYTHVHCELFLIWPPRVLSSSFSRTGFLPHHPCSCPLHADQLHSTSGSKSDNVWMASRFQCSHHFWSSPLMTPTTAHIAFIGGGNMASAIIGGLLRQGLQPSQITVVEPFADTAAKLQQDFGITALPHADSALSLVDLVVWAVKPQVFNQAAIPVMPFTPSALHLSVAAGIRTDSIARWVGSDRVVRCMPNTPALVGQGITGLFACPSVTADDKTLVELIIGTTGQYLWLEQESHLDAVTALSGSGPAYVFYFLEAMTQAGVGMGLTTEQAHTLAVATFSGASSLAAASKDAPEVLRQRVTSKGGTTYAAITSLDQAGVKTSFVLAMQAAELRARELGDEFGKA